MKRVIRKIPIILYSALLLVMGLRTSLAIPQELASRIDSSKMIILGFLLLTLTVNWLCMNGVLNRKIFISALIYPIYYLAISLFYKNSLNIYTSILYFVWVYYIFILSFIFLNDDIKIREYFLYTIAAASLVLLWGLYSTYTNIYTETIFIKRYTMGYENPNYYAQYWQIIFISLVILYKSMSKWVRIFSILIMIISIYHVFLANSRNVIVWMLVFIYLFYIYKLRGKIILQIMGALLVIFTLSTLSYDQANSLSSGRLVIWEYKINEMLSQSTMSLLFGANDIIDTSHMVNRYSRVSNVNSIQKLHADNSYLELYMEGGLLGIIIFLIPYYYVYKIVKYSDHYNKRMYYSIYVAYLAQSLFITTITSFFSPLVIFMGVVLILPYIRSRNIKNSCHYKYYQKL